MEYNRPGYTINQKIKCNDIKLLPDNLLSIAQSFDNCLTCKSIYLNKDKKGLVSYRVSIKEFCNEDSIITLDSNLFSLYETEQSVDIIEYFEGLSLLETMHLVLEAPNEDKIDFFKEVVQRVFPDEKNRLNSQEFIYLNEVCNIFKNKA